MVATALLSSVEPLSTAAEALSADAILEEPLFATPTQIDRVGRIVAPVMINGRGPFRMLVDTGASRTTLSPELAQILGLEGSPEQTVLLNGVTGAAHVPYVNVSRIQAGDFVLHDTATPIIHAPIMAGAQGILGVAAFKNERILVDFKRDRIEISRSRLYEKPMPGTVSMPAHRVAGGLFAIDAYVGRVKTRIVVDTGGERTLGNLALRDAIFRRKGAPEVRTTRVYGATMDIDQGEYFYAPPIKLGPATLTDVAVIYGDFHVFKVWGLENKPTMLLGMDVIGVLDQLVIDYKRKELRVRTRSISSMR
jgi:predicted aspartyl protease